jgi:hypothetical protein
VGTTVGDGDEAALGVGLGLAAAARGVGDGWAEVLAAAVGVAAGRFDVAVEVAVGGMIGTAAACCWLATASVAGVLWGLGVGVAAACAMAGAIHRAPRAAHVAATV